VEREAAQRARRDRHGCCLVRVRVGDLRGGCRPGGGEGAAVVREPGVERWVAEQWARKAMDAKFKEIYFYFEL
jgi:hypothetical protein